MAGIRRRTTLARKAVSYGLKWTSRITRMSSRKTGSEAIGRAEAGQFPFGASQWKLDYAARGGPGEPRGRNFGEGWGTDNPTWPARAEGEKRFRSLTRNP